MVTLLGDSVSSGVVGLGLGLGGLGGIVLVIVLVWGARFGFWDCFSDLGLVVVSSSGIGGLRVGVCRLGFVGVLVLLLDGFGCYEHVGFGLVLILVLGLGFGFVG